MNEWLDMFGLESIWNDTDWPNTSIFLEEEEEECLVANKITGSNFRKEDKEN